MNRPNITEYNAIELFNNEFGKDILTRFDKVEEEFNETKVEIKILELDPELLCDKEHIEKIKGEICDLYATVTHLASLFDLYQVEMLHYTIDKVKGRKNNPNYKRFPSNHNGINSMESFIAGDHEQSNNT